MYFRMTRICADCCSVHVKDHYDFGMRAVKTVISAAGNLKRENLDMDEVRNSSLVKYKKRQQEY